MPDDCNYADMSVADIMRRWPDTIGVFIDLDLHCIGCPVGHFRKPLDAAASHGVPYDLLLAELASAIAGARTRAVPAPGHPRSAATGADP